MTLLAFMCLGVAVKGFSQYDISKTTLKVDWQMNAPFSTDFADKLSGWGMSYELGYQFTPRWEAGVFASFHTNHKYVDRHPAAAGRCTVSGLWQQTPEQAPEPENACCGQRT